MVFAHIVSIFRRHHQDTAGAEVSPVDVAPSMAHTVRSILYDKCNPRTMTVERGVYTAIAHELGTSPTHVSIIAKRAGFKVAPAKGRKSEVSA